MATPKKPGASGTGGSKTTPAKAAATKISPARLVAFQLLRELSASAQAHSDDLLQGPKIEALSPQDRNLCTALVMGVLRWQLVLDSEIAGLLKHKSKMDEPVRIALRLGMFQLLLLDRIPAHAAISDSVELTKRAGHRFASGLVNAVLRKVAADAENLREKMSSEVAHPAWLVERWTSVFGASRADAICAYDQRQPQTVLRIAPDAIDIENPASKDPLVLEPGAFLASAQRVLAGTLDVRHTETRLQDEGSQLVAELLGGTSHAVKSILDCCAAPGGKTAILVERYPAARVVAWDVSAKRLEHMRERFTGSSSLERIVYIEGDATQMPVENLYDLILCDVPCSGTGTLARNPEIKQRLQPEDLDRQSARQVAILAAALRHLAPGGRLLYSTCSLEPEENEAVIEQVLAQSKHARLLPIADRLHELLAQGVLHPQGAEHLLEHAVRGGFLRTIPGVSPCDGFFAALFTL